MAEQKIVYVNEAAFQRIREMVRRTEQKPQRTSKRRPQRPVQGR